VAGRDGRNEDIETANCPKVQFPTMPADCEPESTLAAEIEMFIERPAYGDFNDLFVRLFARHYLRNHAYRVYCDSFGMTPATVGNWRDVPAVPAAAFKTVALSCVPVKEAALVFHSSGTTDGRPGKHYLDETAVKLYKGSLSAGYYKRLPRSLPLLALMPTPDAAPNSSLSYMLRTLGARGFYWDDPGELRDELDRVVAVGEAVCVFGTAFAFVELFDTQERSWILPTGSYVIETGGTKGRTRHVERDELYQNVGERLGVRAPFALAEYGMSEMASQYYGAPGAGLTGGHWVRNRIIDPITQLDAREGLLVHYDLANWNSVGAIQTQDIGRRVGDSDAFELLGRAPQAEIRGCSLTVEERWTTATSRS
jgi:hypothetical protein